MKKVILARPSSLIVTDMKKLVSATGFEAQPIGEIKELTRMNHKDVAGIVISTALSSTVKEKYGEVIKRSVALFPGKPIFLASYATARSTKITASSHIKNAGLDFELLAVEEAKSITFDANKQILILTQQEISDPVVFPSVCELMKSLLVTSTVTKPVV
ncbi:MAG: hypothetical protein ABJG47_05795 [Ekhidna sp.]